MLKRSTVAQWAATLVLIAGAFFPVAVKAQTIPGTSIPLSVTHLVIANGNAQPIVVGITCPSGANIEDGCTTTVANLEMINMTPGFPNTILPVTVYGTTPVKGIFTIPSGQSWELVNTLTNPFGAPGLQEQNCLQGLIISFGQLPACPGIPPAFPQPGNAGPAIPNGVSAGEPTLNLPHTIGGSPAGGANEACDVTCVNGANAIIQLTVTSPSSGALPWTYDAAGQILPGQSFATQNSWVNVSGGCDNNCVPERVGVFPFGCTQCNRFPDPAPPCGQFCATANGLPPNTGCQFARAANTANPVTSQFGGSVVFTYVGPAIPPFTCKGVPGFNPFLGGMKCKVIKPIKDFKLKPIPPFKLIPPKHQFGIRDKDLEKIKDIDIKPFKDDLFSNKCIKVL